LPLEIRDDRHFLSTPDEFEAFAAGRKSLVMETFYRGMRRRHGILIDGERPLGGRWNFDTENRETFGKAGPSALAHSEDSVWRGFGRRSGSR
jgi:deoxyribodipyrimidine photolyase-related protein